MEKSIKESAAPVLYLVVPCYNEEEVLPETSKRLLAKLKELEKTRTIVPSSRIVFVDDGSRDQTWNSIEKLHSENSQIIGIKLAHNAGHQNALLAGLMFAKEKADVVISLDADLQDDIDAIDKMLEKFTEGNEVVYGVRSSRKKDTVFKRQTALFFYKLMRAMGVEVVHDHADYRLMSKRALNELAEFKEVNLFLRGIVPLIGLKSATVKYERGERFAGESKYPLHKMVSFALDGITSLSIKPIRFILAVGVLMFIVGVIMTIYALVQKILGNTLSGWTFLACSIWALGGVQMISLGVIGEYIGKIYRETKARPRYIIEKTVE